MEHLISIWVEARQKFEFLSKKTAGFSVMANISIKKLWPHANLGLLYQTRSKHEWIKETARNCTQGLSETLSEIGLLWCVATKQKW